MFVLVFPESLLSLFRLLMWAFSLALLIKLNLVRKDTFTLDTAELLFFFTCSKAQVDTELKPIRMPLKGPCLIILKYIYLIYVVLLCSLYLSFQC